MVIKKIQTIQENMKKKVKLPVAQASEITGVHIL
jgi:hypothetical protein